MRTQAPATTGIMARSRAVLAGRRVNLVVRSAGYLAIFGGFLVVLQGSVIAGLWLVFLGWLVTRAARATYNVGRLSFLLDGLAVRDALDPDPPSIAPTLILETLVAEDSRQTGGSGVYPVRQGTDVLGIVDVLDADEVDRGAWGTTPVRAVMRGLDQLTTVPPDEPLLDTVARFEKTRREAFAVVDATEPGRLLGLVTRERVHALMRSRAARADRARGVARR